MSRRRRVVIMGAAGRDFHNFNVVYRHNDAHEVVAFTGAQIPGIAGRRYPPELAGALYPEGIPIVPEEGLAELCRTGGVDEVVFAYSDVRHETVMHKASIALAAGADFTLLGPARTALESRVPVIAVCAVRTGVGKSQTTRWLSALLRREGLRAAVMRHPMPYGDLAKQAVQHFTTMQDLDDADCTVEEREEYEPHIAAGNAVFAGVDYARLLEMAEAGCDVVLWDGGNNDFSFIRPDLHVVLVDPLRPDSATTHHPGEAVLRMADIVVIAKSNSAGPDGIRKAADIAAALAPGAAIVRAASHVTLDEPHAIRGRRVLVVEDGPTITHGGMAYGAGHVAALEGGAREIVDPRPFAVGRIAEMYREYPHIGRVLPAMGYSAPELADLGATINASGADAVVTGTPSDLSHLLALDIPIVRARYEFAETEEPGLGGLVRDFLRAKSLIGKGRGH
ncbi:MAG: cyclic 2,3-diphosphoglycerate synthase [Rhodospirillaceae bacterium]